MESTVSIMVLITVVIAAISFAFYWLFKTFAKKVNNVIQEEETSSCVNPLPETIQTSTTRVVKPTVVRLNNESRVSRNSQISQNNNIVRSKNTNQPTSQRHTQRGQHDDWNHTTNSSNILDNQ